MEMGPATSAFCLWDQNKEGWMSWQPGSTPGHGEVAPKLHGLTVIPRELYLDSRPGQLRAHRLGSTRGPEGSSPES